MTAAAPGRRSVIRGGQPPASDSGGGLSAPDHSGGPPGRATGAWVA